MAISFAVLGAVVVLFVWNRVPAPLVALLGGLVLHATGVLTLDELLAGYGDATVIFIATLFVVSEALEASGVSAWAGQWLTTRAGNSRTRLMLLVTLPVAVASAAITVNGAVAALLPVAVILAVRLSRPPSQLLLPMVFAAHAGSLLTLTGAPVNVIVVDAARDAGLPPFGFFSFALAGAPILLGTVLIVLLFGERLLPRRTAKTAPSDFSEHAAMLVRQYQLESSEERKLFTSERGVVEVVVPPRSPLVGMSVYPGMVTPSGDLVILAVQRRGAPLEPLGAALEVGDALLLRGRWSALNLGHDDEVLVVDAPEALRRQVVPLGFKAREALAVLGGMVLLLATGVVPPALAGLIAVAALLLMRVVTLAHAARAISWPTVLLVATMIPVSTAIENSGAAKAMAEGLLRVVGAAGPYAVMLGLMALTVTLGQLISNMATSLIVIPVALSAAAQLQISARPLLMAVAVTAAAALLTPVATPVNLMVKGPGGYRFGDYWRLGLPVLVLYFAVAALVIPLVWPF